MLRLVIAAVLSLSSVAARAEQGRVVLLVDDTALERAIDVTLEPWSLQVRALRSPAPPPDVSAALRRAQEIARDEHAAAVVWLSVAGADVALFVYDAGTGQIVARTQIQAPPYDAAGAAAVALSVKTLLRTSTVAPPQERIGADPRPHRTQLRLEAVGGGRALFGDPQAFELRLGVGVGWWPRQLRQHLGIAIGFRAGPGVGVDVHDFSGRFIDIALGLSLRTRVAAGSRVAFEPQLGASAHFTTLDGGIPPLGVRTRIDRTNPALDGGLAMDVHLGQSIHLGLLVTLSYLFRYQRYLVLGSPVMTLYPLELEAALRFTAGVL